MPRYHNINGEIVQFTAEEETARDAEEQAWADGALARAQARLRQERNRRLAQCDWIVTKNAEYGQNISKEWRAYRQALRDLPSITYRPELNGNGTLKMDSVAWPTPPE